MNLKKALWPYYAITFIIFTALLVWGRSGGITGHELGYIILGFIVIVPATVFVVALILGLKKAHSIWVYPIAATTYATLIMPWVFLFPHRHVSLGSFLEYIGWGVFFLLVSFCGLGIGTGVRILMHKKRSKSR